MVTAQNISIGLNPAVFEKTSFEKAIIHFKDGTDIEGIGRLKTIFTSQEDVIIFKVEEKDKDETWTVKDVEAITIISDDDGIKDYEYLKVSKSSFAELYEVVTDGTVKLYKKSLTTNMVFPATGINNIPQSTTVKNVVYYLKREKEPYPTRIRDNYIKATAEYMKDCEVMVEKIKNHEYNYIQLKDLVDYYNANCGND